jgi:predicted peroxiredoxin
MPTRRELIDTAQHACTGLVAAAALAGSVAAANEPKQRFLLIGLCGSENPTRANFPFAWGAALHEAGHEVRIELAGDATVLMRSVVASNVTPVGWPPLQQAIAKIVDYQIPIFV